MTKLPNPIFELGSAPLASWRQSIITGGLVAAALGRAALSVEVDSLAHKVVLLGLVVSVIVMFSNLLISKSVTAVNEPDRRAIFSFVFLSVPIYRKSICLQNTDWVRVRYDGDKELFVEAVTRGYETTEIVRLPYNEGLGINNAVEKSEQLASLWKVENRGYQGLA